MDWRGDHGKLRKKISCHIVLLKRVHFYLIAMTGNKASIYYDKYNKQCGIHVHCKNVRVIITLVWSSQLHLFRGFYYTRMFAVYKLDIEILHSASRIGGQGLQKHCNHGKPRTDATQITIATLK